MNVLSFWKSILLNKQGIKARGPSSVYELQSFHDTNCETEK